MSHELILERVVPLTPQQLWRAWTEPELLKPWFCPSPWQVPEAEIDLRPGGIFRTVMQGPDGERFDLSGCCLEVLAPHRLVWTSALGPGFVPRAENPEMPAFTCVLTFEPVEGGTRYTVRAIHRDDATAEVHSKMGFHEGWGQALTQLVEAASKGMKGHIAEA